MNSIYFSYPWHKSFLSVYCYFSIVLFGILHVNAQYLPQLKVGPEHQFLYTEEGKPFFWLGDTAWELFHRLNREEAKRYLQDRADKGFTVIQAVVLAELDGLHTPNAYGHTPLIKDDPSQPREAYFKHVDYIVNLAEELGLYIGMLPTWGDKFNKKWGVGPEVFTVQNAEDFGYFLGSRYKHSPIIWVLGGDRNPDSDYDIPITNAMARGIDRGNGGQQLMTFHPQGEANSASWFHQSDWLDFNMIQSGHKRPAKSNYAVMLENLALEPKKPTLDGEPCYEDHPVKGELWNKRNEKGVYLPWFDEWDIRVAAYQSVLSGALGHTYGHHSIWQMWEPDLEPLSICRTPWFDALDHPGAFQMGYMRNLFESRPFWKLQSDQTIIVGENPAGNDHIRAARAKDGSFALIYIPTGLSLSINTQNLNGSKFKVWWFNPRQNTAQFIGIYKRKDQLRFQPPSSGRSNDWVLIIDDNNAELPQLGTSYQHLTPKVE